MRLSLLPITSLVTLLIAGCAPHGLKDTHESHAAALTQLKKASAQVLPAEERAAQYLAVAQAALRDIDSPEKGASARTLYNRAAADLVVMLRDSRNGTLWNRPLTIGSGDATYQLRFAGKTGDGLWDPAYFTSFTRADSVAPKTIERSNRQDGIGGALVGIRKTSPLEKFSPLVGVTAPVTAVLDFKGNRVILSLIDPTVKTKSRVAGKDRPIEADFSAPLAYYPQKSELWEGLMGAMRVADHMKTTGLYTLQPYDPDRIPLIFVHGLISTPRMWRNVINELEADPGIRRRYQCMVFAYPTGNPPLYSAMRLREELEKFHTLHPDSREYVLVGHSMGGILSRTQVATVRREDWNVIGEDKAKQFFAKVPEGSVIDRSTRFEANPRIARAIFICSPHRGSEMAISSIGEIGMRLISLPVDLASTVTTTVGDSIAVITGDPKRLPNSVSGLSPTNPAYKVLDSTPITATHHSIIGDRGRDDTPNSSDGVVEYWSSHLKSAHSEKIVPGPHGSCELPETIGELRRILHLHLKSNQQKNTP
jgi:pimeloyl-ACP methyl ester carboxylesterase